MSLPVFGQRVGPGALDEVVEVPVESGMVIGGARIDVCPGLHGVPRRIEANAANQPFVAGLKAVENLPVLLPEFPDHAPDLSTDLLPDVGFRGTVSRRLVENQGPVCQARCADWNGLGDTGPQSRRAHVRSV